VWNKRPDEEPGRPAAAPPTPHTPQTMPSTVVSRPANKATIGSSMHIKGEIRTDEELVVDGEVEGSLESQSVLTIGKNGKVKANIKAREVIIYGSVRGNIEVAEKLAIRDQGSVIGDIKTAGISIDDGAYFKGSIDIARPEPKAKTA
jgi:cytoskeletal protein CcmA (bactofilin family)